MGGSPEGSFSITVYYIGGLFRRRFGSKHCLGGRSIIDAVAELRSWFTSHDLAIRISAMRLSLQKLIKWGLCQSY